MYLTFTEARISLLKKRLAGLETLVKAWSDEARAASLVARQRHSHAKGEADTFVVHRELKSGALAKEPSTPFRQHSPIMTIEDSMKHQAEMSQMNPNQKYVIVHHGEPLPDEGELTRQAGRERQAQRGARFLAQRHIGPIKR